MNKNCLIIFLVLFFSGSLFASNLTDINIANNLSIDLIDYQVKLVINQDNVSDNFDWDLLGADLQLIDSNDNDLYFWIEDFDSDLNSAIIWVKVPIIPANDNVVITLKYNQAQVDRQDGDNTFIFFDDFSEDKINPYPASGLDNADTNLTIPTYDGSGQNVHPSLVYFEEPFNGWKYWMAITPYADSNKHLENPSIVVSNDGLTWQEPDGIINPVDQFPGGNTYNSDPSLFYDEENEKFILYYREMSDDSGLYEHIKYRESSNGINWSEEQNVLTELKLKLISPTVIKKDGVYYMWVVSTDGGCNLVSDSNLVRYSSNDGITWNPGTKIINNLPLENGLKLWHPDIKYMPEFNEYWMIFSASSGNCNNVRTYFARSPDGINWQAFSQKAIDVKTGSWDNGAIYKSTFLYDSNTNKIRVWYSVSNNSSVWNTGYTELDYNKFLMRLDLDLIDPLIVKWHFIKTTATNASMNFNPGYVSLTGDLALNSSASLRSTKTFFNDVIIEIKETVTQSDYVNTSIGKVSATPNTLCDSGSSSSWNVAICEGYFFWSWFQSPNYKWYIYKLVSSSSKSSLNGTGLLFSYPINIPVKTKFVYTYDGNVLWYLNDELKTQGFNEDYRDFEKNLLISQGKNTTRPQGTRTIDYVFVREYVEIEPTVTYNIVTAPTTTISGLSENWEKDAQTLTLSCSDTSRCQSTFYRFNLSDWFLLNYDSNQIVLFLDGNIQLDYYSINTQGGIEEIKTSFVLIDYSPPTFVVDNNATWFNDDFNISFDVNFDISGKSEAKYKLNESESWTDFTEDYNILIDVDGNNTIDYWFRDLAGNDTNGTVYGLLDKSSPIINSIDNNSTWFNDDFNISFDINFDLSGKSISKYNLNDAGFVDFSSDYNLLIDQDGNHEISYWFRDVAGNDTNGVVYALLDKTAPIINSVDNNSTWFNNDFNISFDINFDLSGKSLSKYNLNDAGFVDFSSDYNLLIDQDGNHEISYWFRDVAGNDTNGVVYALLDKTAPIIDELTISNLTTNSARITIAVLEVNDFNCRYDSNQDILNFDQMNQTTEQDGNAYWDLTGLNNDTNYEYYFICRDAVENDSNRNSVSFKTNRSTQNTGGSGSSGGTVFIPVTNNQNVSEVVIVNDSQINVSDAIDLLNENNVDLTNKKIITNQDDIIISRKSKKLIELNKIKLNVIISIENKTAHPQEISIIEVIPKEIADHVDRITFEIYPSEIIDPDPIVKWDLSLMPNSDQNIYYTINDLENHEIVTDTFINNWDNSIGLLNIDHKKLEIQECPKNSLCVEYVLENGKCVSKYVCDYLDDDTLPVIQKNLIDHPLPKETNRKLIGLIVLFFFLGIIFIWQKVLFSKNRFFKKQPIRKRKKISEK